MFKRWHISPVMLAVGILVGFGGIETASAAILWYNGDFQGEATGSALANEFNSAVSQSAVYENFIIPAGETWTINSVFSNNLMDFVTSSADFEIRSGMSPGVGGTLEASGTGLFATQSLTGRSGFGFDEFMVEITGLSINLGPGEYWLNVTPVGSGSGRSFISTTDKTNLVGDPAALDGRSIWNSTDFAQSFSDAGIEAFGAPTDFSNGLSGTVATAIVPEPTSLAIWGLGAVGLACLKLRRRKRAA